MIEELLTRGVEKIYPSKEELEKVLRSGKKLRLYQGFDPSGIQLHIGHMMGLMKLRQWQQLDHEVIFLIGDGTGQAGDPSGKTRAREKFLVNKELRENAKDYVMQASKILNFKGENPVKILYNGDWLNKLGLVDLLDIAGRISFQQMVERDLYQERLRSGKTFTFREFMYPLLQGYDSVAMKVDLELGGSDQTFNMLMGRHLVKSFLGKEKFVMTTPLLIDSRGKKIGKTEGNVIALTSPPNDFYGMIMSLGDDVIVKCFEYLTDLPMEEVHKIDESIKSGANPMTYKKQLAYKLTEMLNTKEEADRAEHEFEKVHQQGQQPTQIPSFKATKTEYNIIDLLVETGLCASRSEAKRLIEQKAVEIDEKKVENIMYNIQVKNGMIIKVGKTKFVKVLQ